MIGRPKEGVHTLLTDSKLPVRATLAGLWASLMFLYVYVDVLSFYRPGVIDDILAGIVWEFEISEAFAVGALALMIVPSLMVALSLVLPARANRTLQLVVAPVYIVISIGNVVGESWVLFYGLAIVVEVAVLALVMRSAWRWPRRSASERSVAAAAPAAAIG